MKENIGSNTSECNIISPRMHLFMHSLERNFDRQFVQITLQHLSQDTPA